MKRVTTMSSRVFRLCITVGGLLCVQQSFAAGTPSDTLVSNQATVSYSVGTVAQPDVPSNTVTFRVDERVLFTLVEQGGTHTTVTPGQADAVTTFLLTNDGNAGTQDFALSALNLNGGTVNTLTDSGTGAGNDVEEPPRVFADTNGSGVFDAGDLDFVDELPDVDLGAGENSILVFVVANVPVGLTNGIIANVELTATAHEGGGATTLGAVTAEDDGVADDPDTVQVVFANGSTGEASATEVAEDGYAVESANISAVKSTSVIDDGFSAANPKAIPGAVVEYSVVVTNAGAQDATGVGITDTLDANVTIALAEYAGGDAEIEQNGSVIFSCTLDASDADADGCGIAGGVVSMTPGGASAVTLATAAPNNEATFRFRVTVN